MAQFMSSDERRSEIKTFGQRARVPWIAHPIESGNARNRIRPTSAVDVVPGQHKGVVPVSNPQILLVPAEPVQIKLGIAISVQMGCHGALKKRFEFLSGRGRKLTGWTRKISYRTILKVNFGMTLGCLYMICMLFNMLSAYCWSLFCAS